MGAGVLPAFAWGKLFAQDAKRRGQGREQQENKDGMRVLSRY